MPQTQAVQTRDSAELPALLTVAEVATALRVDPSTVYRAVQADEIRAVRLAAKTGRTIRIPASELERILAGNGAAAEAAA